MRFDLAEPCTGCPFRRTSCPGWTGPFKPDKLIDKIRNGPFPCHRTISHDGQRIEDETLQGCAGAAIFLNNSGEPSASGWTRHQQELLEHAPETVRTNVFETPEQLLAHHRRNANPETGDENTS